MSCHVMSCHVMSCHVMCQTPRLGAFPALLCSALSRGPEHIHIHIHIPFPAAGTPRPKKWTSLVHSSPNTVPTVPPHTLLACVPILHAVPSHLAPCRSEEGLTYYRLLATNEKRLHKEDARLVSQARQGGQGGQGQARLSVCLSVCLSCLSFCLPTLPVSALACRVSLARFNLGRVAHAHTTHNTHRSRLAGTN